MGMIYAEQLEYMSVEQMQQTHEQEIKILNEIDKLATGCAMGRGEWADLENRLDEYIAHVKEHFENEERLMEEYDFPSYDMHKMAHDMFAFLTFFTLQIQGLGFRLSREEYLY